ARSGLQSGVIEALIVEMTIHAVEPGRHPTSAGFEETDAQLRMPLDDAAPNHAHAGEHHLHRVRDDVLGAAALKAVDTDCRHIEARTFMNSDRHIELFGGIPERLVVRVVEHFIVVRIWPDEAGAHT